ncbi:MAG: hypothetical protein ABW123_07885 [Cystobacter sp.]
MMKTLKMGVLGLTLGLTGAIVFSSQEARAVPKAPDSNQCKLIRAACILKSASCQSAGCPTWQLCMAMAGC